MKYLFLSFVASACLFTSSTAHAEIVESGSKYPIVISIFKGSSHCKPNGDSLRNVGNNANQTYQKMNGSTLQKSMGRLKQAYNSVMMGSGCEKIGNDYILSNNKQMNLPVGSIIVAFKEPLTALTQYNKIVNPMPVILRIQPNVKTILVTKKIVGGAGDLGLMAQIK